MKGTSFGRNYLKQFSSHPLQIFSLPRALFLLFLLSIQTLVVYWFRQHHRRTYPSNFPQIYFAISPQKFSLCRCAIQIHPYCYGAFSLAHIGSNPKAQIQSQIEANYRIQSTKRPIPFCNFVSLLYVSLILYLGPKVCPFILHNISSRFVALCGENRLYSRSSAPTSLPTERLAARK